MRERADIVIVGAGAAGLMAGISAGRALRARGVRIVALDGAKKLGAKILVAGGGRCNVTHDVVDESAYAGSSRAAVRKVILGFDVARTVALFREIGVELKREETGKLFPTSDDGHTVLAALLHEAERVGVELMHPARVVGVRRVEEGFEVEAERGEGAVVRGGEGREGRGGTGGTPVPRGGEGGRFVIGARAVVIATGGMALPRSGSDGSGYGLVRGLGHTVSARVFPALVPLTMPKGHWLCGLSGVSAEVEIELRSGTGKKLAEFAGSLLLTHFGVSGPAALDISRYYLDECARDSGCALVVRWLPGGTLESVDRWLLEHTGRGVARVVSERVPERLARALCEQAGAEGAVGQLSRETRRRLAGLLVATKLEVTGDRGFTFAEVTAGGVALSELHLSRMESRVMPGLFVCGEICDVDGRIGGYNFQWAWSSGFLAGEGAAATVGG